MLLQRIADRGLLNSMREIDLLRQHADQMLAGQRSLNDFPALNVFVSENGAIVEAELPGIEAEDLEISVMNEILTLRGSRQQNQLKEGEKYHRQERGFGQFSRSIQLPFAIESQDVSASLQKGLLRIELPRAKEDLPRKITVKSA